jgi:hypothetical protein
VEKEAALVLELGGARQGGRRRAAEEEGAVGLRFGGKPPGMRSLGGFAHFAAAIAAAAGAGTVRFPSPFCASGLGWGTCWS